MSEDKAVAWLREQVEGDKALAGDAGGGSWHTGCGCDHGCRDYPDCRRVEGTDITIYDEGGHDSLQAMHIARHDPQDVIADCEAKLQLLKLCQPPSEAALETQSVEETVSDQVWSGLVLKTLAAGYRYRDGYTEHWG